MTYPGAPVALESCVLLSDFVSTMIFTFLDLMVE